MPSSTHAIIKMAAAVALAAAIAAALSVAHARLLAQRESWPDLDQVVLVPSPQMARMLSAGENELWADVVWARTLVFYGDRMATHGDMSQVDELIAVVNALDPFFRRPYEWGAYAVMHRKATEEKGIRVLGEDDIQDSIAILKRAIKAFPNDWQFHWLLGIRYYLDLKSSDPEEARRFAELGAESIERAMRIPGSPPDLPLIAASLRTRLGQTEQALKQLREMILTTSDPDARKVLEQRYAHLVDQEASEALAEASAQFTAEWKKALPYASSHLYVLVGQPPRSIFDPTALSEGETFFPGLGGVEEDGEK